MFFVQGRLDVGGLTQDVTDSREYHLNSVERSKPSHRSPYRRNFIAHALQRQAISVLSTDAKSEAQPAEILTRFLPGLQDGLTKLTGLTLRVGGTSDL